MIDELIGSFSPHICKGCSEQGTALCNSCLFNIVDEKYKHCVVCDNLVTQQNMCCKCTPSMPFDRIWAVGERTGVLKRVVGDFKYNSECASAVSIAKLLDVVVPVLPNDTIIVPIPTIQPHIRQRGFGHTELVAKRLGKIRKLQSTTKLLLRNENSIQHGLTARERRRQAERAFRVALSAVLPREILLIDDIYTTGATLMAAAKLLRAAGVETINVAVVARQVKESRPK